MADTIAIEQSRREHHARELLYQAMPIIGMTVSRMAMGFIDFIMVSKLGTEAQAAISPATVLVFALACLGMGAAQSIQTFVSQADGRGEPRCAGAFAWQSYYVALVVGLVTLPAVLTTAAWMGWFGATAGHAPAVVAMEIDYLAIGLWSVAPATICAGLNGFFMGIQRSRIGLVAVLASLLVNIVGNYLLIYGKFGFPEMGIAGAALATLIGWCVRAIVLTCAMLLPQIDERFNTRHSMAPDRQKLAGIVKVGGPTSIQWLIDIGSWVVFMAVIVPPFGTAAMAASNIALQYMHLSFMPAVGIGIALCTQTGFAIGEGRPERAVLKARVAMQVTGAYMGAVGLFLLVARYPLMDLMVMDGNPEVIRIGTTVLIWAAIFQVFDAMGITYMNALRGAGDTRIPALMVAFCCWVVFIVGGYIVSRFVPQWGLNGPWAMCTIYISLLGILLLWRWRSGVWRNIRLFEDKPKGQAQAEAEAQAQIAPSASSANAPAAGPPSAVAPDDQQIERPDALCGRET